MSSVMAYSAVMNTMVDRRKRYLKSLIIEMNSEMKIKGIYLLRV